jgi:hypothetical protein
LQGGQKNPTFYYRDRLPETDLHRIGFYLLIFKTFCPFFSVCIIFHSLLPNRDAAQNVV